MADFTQKYKQPNPHEIRPHRFLEDGDTTIGGSAGNGTGLASGRSVTNATEYKTLVPIAGARFFRGRLKATVAGTLRAFLLLADGVTRAATGNPADVPVTANTEAKIDIDDLHGEGFLELSFTPSATGTLNYADVCQL